MGIFSVWWDIGLCHWPHIWAHGAQCKCKCWFVFKAFLWTCLVEGQNPSLIDGLLWVCSQSAVISVCAIYLEDGKMVRNVNLNVDLCFWISCELVRWLTISKSQTLEIFYRAGGRWRGKWQFIRYPNQRWGARVQTHQKDVLPKWFLAVVFEGKMEDNWLIPWHHCF